MRNTLCGAWLYWACIAILKFYTKLLTREKNERKLSMTMSSGSYQLCILLSKKIYYKGLNYFVLVTISVSIAVDAIYLLLFITVFTFFQNAGTFLFNIIVTYSSLYLFRFSFFYSFFLFLFIIRFLFRFHLVLPIIVHRLCLFFSFNCHLLIVFALFLCTCGLFFKQLYLHLFIVLFYINMKR